MSDYDLPTVPTGFAAPLWVDDLIKVVKRRDTVDTIREFVARVRAESKQDADSLMVLCRESTEGEAFGIPVVCVPGFPDGVLALADSDTGQVLVMVDLKEEVGDGA